MACACKVTQQIDYLHKKYGDNIPKSKKTNIAASIEAKLENIFIFILLLPLTPFLLLYILFKSIKGQTITIDNFFKPFLKHNVRNEQITQG
jgi:hypothetical protein